MCCLPQNPQFVGCGAFIKISYTAGQEVVERGGLISWVHCPFGCRGYESALGDEERWWGFKEVVTSGLSHATFFTYEGNREKRYPALQVKWARGMHGTGADGRSAPARLRATLLSPAGREAGLGVFNCRIACVKTISDTRSVWGSFSLWNLRVSMVFLFVSLFCFLGNYGTDLAIWRCGSFSYYF